MTQPLAFSDYAARARAAMRRALAEPSRPGLTDDEFGALALELFGLQFAGNAAYRRFCGARRVAPGGLDDWRRIPAMPSSAFKECELTSLAAAERIRVFYSSGTTGRQPGRHFHDAESLGLYEASLLPWFARHLVPETGGNAFAHDPGVGVSPIFIALTPPPEAAPNSSLVHMFETAGRALGGAGTRFMGFCGADGGWEVDGRAVVECVETIGKAPRERRPTIIVMGTAFNFVHWLDYCDAAGVEVKLPAGARILETGGYKGRSRVIPKARLHELLAERFGVAEENMVCEYGMSELSSQAYDGVAGAARRGERRLVFPPWARVQVVSPETGAEVAEGETGLIRVFDLANLRSVMAVQTEDLGLRRGGGFELIGRASLAEPRGCSLQSA